MGELVSVPCDLLCSNKCPRGFLFFLFIFFSLSLFFFSYLSNLKIPNNTKKESPDVQVLFKFLLGHIC